ncbi:MAG: PA14 domain-containing protein [Verrucomicrobiota bacterium]
MKTTSRFLMLSSIAALSLSAAHGQDAKVLELGKTTYQACATCHGQDGKGMQVGPAVMAPSLHDSQFVTGESSSPLAALVLKGIQKQDDKYVQAMLALEKVLNDDQMAAVLTYVRSEFGGQKATINPDDVKKWRKEYKGQKAPYKRDDLNQLLLQSNHPLFSDITYSIYEGKNWKKLPDFSKLEAKETGEIKTGKIDLDVAKKFKPSFGIVFEGNLTVPETDTFEFDLVSDDGSALIIDGENVILNDGIHPDKSVRKKEKLEKGNHTFKVLYFDGGGNRTLSLMSKSKSYGEFALSTGVKKGGGKQKQHDPILINPTDEAIVHRSFLPGSRARGIAIGYPGSVHVLWDAELMNMVRVWRGDFIDTAGHWNGRGCSTATKGQDNIEVNSGFPLQQLANGDETWLERNEGKIKYERDKAEPKNEISFDLHHPDYQFKGYRLGEKRYPTFNYQYQDLSVTDTFQPVMIDGVQSIERHVHITGQPKENTYFRVASAEAHGGMNVKVEGAEITRRDGKGRDGKPDMVAKITGDTQLKITYSWDKPFTQPSAE